MTSINFRAAAFLAEQQRIDFRRGVAPRRVRCNPPNRECHGRCIPPNWNCRLKGEGNDPHLRAAGRGTDIVSGLANVQRGLTSIGKGTAKLSLSEIETGRRALARGAAKLHPGDLKKKEQAKKAVYNTALVILTPLALGITAGLGHRGLKNFRVYREGWGQQIDDTFREVMDRVARNTPGVGDRIRAREEAGLRGLRSVRETEQNIAQNLYSKTQTSSNTLQIAANRRSVNSGRAGVTNSGLGELRDAMSAVDRPFGAAPNYKSYGEWSEKSLQAFWSVERPANLETIAGVGKGSLYSIDSANNLLARSLALSNAEGQPLRLTGLNLKSEAAEVRALIASRLRAEKENIIVGIQQAGLDHKDATSVQQYLQRNAETWRTGNASIDTEIERNIVTLLTGRESELKIADALYRNTVKEYDTFYTNIRDVVSSPPGIAAGPEFDRRRQLYQDALKGHARYLARTIDYPSELPVVGEGGRTLLLKTYYNRRVVTPNGRVTTVSLTDRQMATLAQELKLPSGGFGPELENVLNEHLSQYSIRTGQNRQIVRPLITIRRVQEAAGEARARAARSGTAPEPGAETPAAPEAGDAAPAEPRRNRRRRVSEQQIIQRFIKAGFSEERAREKAAEIIAERAARGDSLDTWTARDDAYLETWIRLDKRCGRSAIPDNYKCSKDTTAASSSTASTVNNVAAKIATGALAVGAVAGAAAIMQDPKKIQRVKVQTKLITRGTDRALRRAVTIGGHGAVAGMSVKQVKEGLSKLPPQLQQPARQLVGAAKKAAASAAMKAEGFELSDIDVKNNFSTWTSKRGSIISIGSYGDSLVTYASDSSHSWNGKRVYKIGFNVDHTFDAARNIPPEQAKQITAGVKRMTDNHLSKIKDGVLATFPWSGDDFGAKRRAIYERAGFNNIVGEESQWALVQQGRIKKMKPTEAFIYLADSGERDAPIYKRQPKAA